MVDFNWMKIGNIAEVMPDFLKFVIQLFGFSVHGLIHHHFDAIIDVLPNFIAQRVLVFSAKLIDRAY